MVATVELLLLYQNSQNKQYTEKIHSLFKYKTIVETTKEQRNKDKSIRTHQAIGRNQEGEEGS